MWRTTYTDAEKNAAKTVAEKLYNDFKAGTISEDAFANLAMEHTDDSNGDNGGLYENVYPGQMIEQFNDWCFDEARQAGDYDLIETEYGWHLMFYVGDSEITYRDYMVSNDKRVEDMESWYENVKESLNWTTVDLSNVPMDLVINGEDSIWDKIFG